MSLHYNAVENYVKHLPEDKQDCIYASIIQLKGFETMMPVRDKADYTWLRHFILAELDEIRGWVANQPDKLKFVDFKELYSSSFSNGADHFVDTTRTYNAYTLIEKMDIHVCPYCDDEYLDVLGCDGKKKRTSEFDHFFPKGEKKYPALAMCFFNLVLSGEACNGVKKQEELGTSPFDDDIEEETFLYPDMEIGVNMENIDPADCKVLLHAKRGMTDNERVLGLKDRYANRYMEAYQLLKRKQQNTDEKLESMVKMGLIESKESEMDNLFGPA